MTAKKLATALGAGTLGASGAAGTAAWNFGLFNGRDLEIKEENGTDQQLKVVPPSLPDGPQEEAGREKSAGNHENDSRDSRAHGGTTGGSGGGGGTVGSEMLYFAGATGWDKKAISQSSEISWSSTVPPTGKVSVTISTSQVNTNNWRCEIEAVILENSNSSDRSEFKRQGEELVGKIKTNDDQRKKFVENCSKARTESEQGDGATSKIYLETEKTGNKFKFKDQDILSLLTKDFAGVYKLGDDEERVLSSMWWDKKVEEADKDQKKVTFDAVFNDYGGKSSNWSCSISGILKGEKTFKDDKLEKILNTFGSTPGIDSEKKKYILRNCLKNNKDIKGLKFKEVGENFMLDDDSLKKITEGMYENPVQAKTNLG